MIQWHARAGSLQSEIQLLNFHNFCEPVVKLLIDQISHDGIIYTMEIGKHYQQSQLLNLY